MGAGKLLYCTENLYCSSGERLFGKKKTKSVIEQAQYIKESVLINVSLP